MNEALTADWVPIGVYGATQPFGVDWCHVGRQRFSDPFFDMSIQRRMQLPFNHLFRPQTGLDDLVALGASRPGLPLAGLIFHTSRCGSTLLAQLLAALDDTVVLSEAPPIDEVLATRWRDPSVSDMQRLAWLRGMVHALGQPRRGGETRLFIKLDFWHTLYLPIIRQAFPHVPWVFLYRDPLEVLVSQARQRAGQMLPGVLPTALLGLQLEPVTGPYLDVYTAQVLARVCRAAKQHLDGQGMLLRYSELLEPGFTRVAAHFDLRLGADERNRLTQVARRDAKAPHRTFVPDSAGKQQEASEVLRHLARDWLAPPIARLDAARLAQLENSEPRVS